MCGSIQVCICSRVFRCVSAYYGLILSVREWTPTYYAVKFMFKITEFNAFIALPGERVTVAWLTTYEFRNSM